MKKYDERETLFSRVGLKKGSKEYIAFYKKHPELKQTDDSQRRISFRNVLRKSDRYKELFFPITKNNKLYIKTLFDMVKSKSENEKRISIEPDFAANLKEITKYYGANSVGIVKLTDYSYYSHFGNLNDEVGIKNNYDKIDPKYSTAIVFTVNMDLDFMNRAPNFEELLTTEEGYVKAANVGARLALYIKELGYKAMFNSSEYYLAPLVPLAYDAGLGQIGMCNHLVTKEYGNNVRLGAVFTTLEVNYDKPIDFGLIEFCNRCALCLSNCPSKAITHKPRIVNGRQFYKFDENRCFDMWIKTGTDCGVCIQSCPFTQGVDLEKLKKYKENPKIIDELMSEHYQKFGRRVYKKRDLDIVKIGDDDGNNA